VNYRGIVFVSKEIFPSKITKIDDFVKKSRNHQRGRIKKYIAGVIPVGGVFFTRLTILGITGLLACFNQIINYMEVLLCGKLWLIKTNVTAMKNV
jgi:hypothetical protein